MDNKTNKPDEITEVIPTLYIALGGTGAEILWRIRRRILNNLWGLNTGSPVRLESLNQFPFAEFLQIDLDANTVTESGKAQKSDILASKIAFKEEERIVKKLDMSKYIKTDGELAKYPNIENWFPLNRAKINELNIDPEKGAGQIRSISRLYFFDKYQEIKSAIKTKADRLMSNVSSESAQKKLGLKTRTGTLNIVVIASTAGGTGSGSFLDLGYLSNIIGKQAAIGGVTCNLALLLPTGYRGANLERTQANTYAALMELETCMRQGSNYINRWSDSEIIRDMPENPYKDVYLIDTCNVSGAQTEDIKDIYDMVADAMFEDFSTAEFANKKRSISVNQQQHKIIPYSSRVDKAKYGDMKLTYSRSFSSFGQATIDTHLEQKQNIVIYKQVNGMLKAFFGITSDETKSNLPTEQERDELISNRLHLGSDNDVVEYDFLNKSDEFTKGVERTTYPLVAELLRVNGISRLDDIEKSITDTFEEIRVGGSFNDWETRIAAAIDKINHDAFKGVEAGSGLFEDGIRKRRNELLNELMSPSKKDGILRALWDRVDNKDRGGLDYTIDLIQRIKDRIDNSNTGHLKVLNDNAKWYADLSGFVRNEDLTKLQSHMSEAISMANRVIFKNKELPASTLKHLAEAVRVYVRYHLYSVACKETAVLVAEISDQLGNKVGVDNNGDPLWDGFIGELEAGRELVEEIIAGSENQINRTNEALKQTHAMYFVLPAPKSHIDTLELLPASQAREWAEEVFKDFGGTEKLFEMLRDEDGRSDLLSKLRNRALKIIADAPKEVETNPLFTALDDHPDRLDLFGKFLQRAVPWVGSTLDRYLKEQTPEDQYKCYVGVKNHKQFEAKYGSEFRSKIPTNAFITANQIAFVEIDQPGKLVCYTELSGIPIASLKALDDWYGSYRVESAKLPVHTHKRTSTFVHPRELTLNELASISQDIRLFVEAVALGVLTRVNNGDDIGIYQLSVKGSKRNVGDERLLRLNGFDISYQKIIKQQVDFDLEQLKNADQLATWCALLEYYKDNVYPIKVVQDNSVDREVESLPTLIANQLVAEYTSRLSRLIGSAQEATRLIEKSRSSILDWSDEIQSSEADIYQYEVNLTNLSPKRVIKSDVLGANWKLNTSAGNAPISNGATPPPLNPDTTQYFIAVNSQQVGPLGYADLNSYIQNGQLTKETLVWKNGMSGWLPSSTVPEIVSLFSVGNAAPPPLPPALS